MYKYKKTPFKKAWQQDLKDVKFIPGKNNPSNLFTKEDKDIERSSQARNIIIYDFEYLHEDKTQNNTEVDKSTVPDQKDPTE